MLGNKQPTFSITENLPEGFRIDCHQGRRQPFTIWGPPTEDAPGGEVLHFTTTRRDAVHLTRGMWPL